MAATSKVSVLFHMRKEDLEKQMNDTDDKRSYAIIRNFGGRRPPHLNTKEMDELYKVITKQKPCDLMDTDHVFWDVELVRKYANTKYDVNYTYSGMWKIVRQKFELNYITPFSKDYRKPDDAVEILKKDLRTSLKSSTKKKRL